MASFKVHRRRWVMAGAFIGACVLGVIGWATTAPRPGEPPTDLWTALYRALGLFVVDGSAHGEHISGPLWLARYLAPAVMAWAVITTAVRVMGDHLAEMKARRSKGHTLVLGDGPEAPVIALRIKRNAHRTSVVVIGGVSASDVAQLRREGVIHLPVADDATLSKVLARAVKVVVSAADDKHAIALMDQVQEWSDAAMVALLSDRELAGDWRAVPKAPCCVGRYAWRRRSCASGRPTQRTRWRPRQ